MRFTESCQSLNKVIWTYRDVAYNTIAPLQLANGALTTTAAFSALAGGAVTGALAAAELNNIDT
eukprot:110980-Hanusia_phi.AAC.1